MPKIKNKKQGRSNGNPLERKDGIHRDSGIDKEIPKKGDKRPVRKAVLNHKVLGTPKITDQSNSKMIDKNNNATCKLTKSFGLNRGVIPVKLKKLNKTQTRMATKDLDQVKTPNILVEVDREFMQNQLLNEQENCEDLVNSDNSDVCFDSFDRMMEDQHVMDSHLEDDIVNVSVDRGEDQDFGMDDDEGNNAVNNHLPVEAIRIARPARPTPAPPCPDTTRGDDISERDILNNPRLEQLIQKMVDDKVARKLNQEKIDERKSHENQNNMCVRTPNRSSDRRIVINKKHDNVGLVKSPSDTTLYAPALRQNLLQKQGANQRLGTPVNTMPMNDHDKDMSKRTVILPHQTCQLRDLNADEMCFVDANGKMVDKSTLQGEEQVAVSNHAKDQMIDKISDFVEGIRINTTQGTNLRRMDDAEPSTSTGIRSGRLINHQDFQTMNGDENANRYTDERDKLTQARTRANRLILEAEQYRAKVEAPKGMSALDDEFFHISCHIDPNLKSKIENGEFVELEKLLPRNNFDNDDDRMELVNREGQIYFVSANSNRDNKIKNVRRWEQAFRVYAAIYSAANPHRSHEIWQYVYVINSAASCYVWEEVAQYDYMFRQLMSRNPGRSWAVTYTQMWQMTLRHVLAKGGNGGNPNSYNHQQQNGQGKRRKKYCWKFNKGQCSDPHCKYPHKCFYCDGKHGVFTCYKKGNRKSFSDKNNSPNVK